MIWYRNNDLDEGKVQLYRFTRRVCGINSSPFIALFAIGKFVAENPTNAGTVPLKAIENSRYMDFKLRKWVANGSSKTVLSGTPKCELGSNIRKIGLSAEPMSNSKTLDVVWNVENDRLRVCFEHQKLVEELIGGTEFENCRK